MFLTSIHSAFPETVWSPPIWFYILLISSWRSNWSYEQHMILTVNQDICLLIFSYYSFIDCLHLHFPLFVRQQLLNNSILSCLILSSYRLTSCSHLSLEAKQNSNACLAYPGFFFPGHHHSWVQVEEEYLHIFCTNGTKMVNNRLTWVGEKQQQLQLQ